MPHESRSAIFLAFVAALLVSAAAHAAVLAVTYAGDLVSIDEATGEATVIGPTGFDKLNGLTRDSSGQLYAVTQGGTIVEVNPETGAGTFVVALPLPSAVHIVRALAVSEAGELYFAHGSLYELSEDTLAKYDLANRSMSSIDVLRVTGGISVSGLTGLTFASDGRLIGWDQAYYGLVEIDPSTATVTRLGPALGPPGANIETVAYAEDGSLHGIGGFSPSGQDNYFDFDARGVPTSRVSIGPLDIRGMELRVTADGDEEPSPPTPPYARLPERSPPPRQIMPHNLYLIDCGPCPQCWDRPCDPRVNPDLGHFLVWDPLRKLAQSFSREQLGLKAGDGPIAAAAPSYGIDGRLLFVASLPRADSRGRDAGAVILFSGDGRIVKRIDGRAAKERLGQSMDVWQDEIVVASTRRLIRLRGEKVALEKSLARALRADREIRVAFTSDMDGDGRPEILLGTPQAAVGATPRAGRVEVIGSRHGQTLDVQYGRFAGQQLGRTLQPMRYLPRQRRE